MTPPSPAHAPLETDDRPVAPPPPRRTVTITGHPDRISRPVRALHEVPAPRRTSGPAREPRVMSIDRRRPPRSASERLGARPDRVALWALLMALFLIVVVATSANAAI